MAFLRTLKKAEVPDGTIREFQLEGKTLAISNVGGKVCAMNSVCLHRAGPLAEGELAGDVVTCPWHGWQYNVCSGKLVTILPWESRPTLWKCAATIFSSILASPPLRFNTRKKL